MRKEIKLLTLMVFMLAGAITMEAQDKVGATLEADIVNQYIWRGQDLGNTALQPTLGINYKGLSLEAWGSVGLTDSSDAKEFDLTLSYTIGGLNFGVSDYWFSDGLDPQGRYFKYDAHGTNHLFEGFVGYDFGVASVAWYTNFAGADGVNKKGKRAYSSYFEVAAPFKLATCDWQATAGAVPYSTDYYGTSGFAVINLALRATKEIKVTNSFSIPIFGEVVGNPCSQKAYLVFGLTLRP
ncbi:MAG: hypothetical protein J6T38_10600 [Bacteroidaceae bacterium]|nr:hypothetical protein [Bacteroidaceae bacterium]